MHAWRLIGIAWTEDLRAVSSVSLKPFKAELTALKSFYPIPINHNFTNRGKTFCPTVEREMQTIMNPKLSLMIKTILLQMCMASAPPSDKRVS